MDIASLVLGIFAIIFSLFPSINLVIALVFAILSIVFSYKARRFNLEPTACAKGGRVCSWVAIGFMIFWIVLFLIMTIGMVLIVKK